VIDSSEPPRLLANAAQQQQKAMHEWYLSVGIACDDGASHISPLAFLFTKPATAAVLTMKSATRLLTTIIMVVLPLARGFVRSSALTSHRLFSYSHPPNTTRRWMASVTGTVYTSPGDEAPTVNLFTKEGCTLCDKVKDILADLHHTDEVPHTLQLVDITDEAHSEWFDKYKYDIPVLHLENKFWIKHRTTVEEAREGLMQAREGTFQEQPGEPDAGAMERKQQ
jgi:hypothetical protein